MRIRLSAASVLIACMLADGRCCHHETRIRCHIGSAWDRSGPGDKTTGWGVGRAERKTAPICMLFQYGVWYVFRGDNTSTACKQATVSTENNLAHILTQGKGLKSPAL